VSFAGETLPLLMRTFAWGTRAMLEGVEICVLDTNDCVLSDADGKAIIDLPATPGAGADVREGRIRTVARSRRDGRNLQRHRNAGAVHAR